MSRDETFRVLVVDDEPGMRLGVERSLRRFSLTVDEPEPLNLGFQISMAESAEEALELITVRPPDILLLDHKLPGMTGLELLERLEQPPEDMLTVMITAYASLDTAVRATKRGAYDFLAKPFTPNELKSVVAKAVKTLLLTRHARRLAEERRRIRFQFISVLSHELKAPLAAIEGYLQLARDEVLGPDLSSYQRPIERSLSRLAGMRKLIFDLLDVTRIEAGQKARQLGPVDLRDMALGAIEAVQLTAEGRGITLQLDGPEELPFFGDRSELEMILNNLVSNAVKYNRDGGQVFVRLFDEDPRVRVEVEDTGIGMSPEETARLFQEFSRIRNDKTKNILGTGLGLSIVKRLAALYQGEVSVSSTPDVGSTFTASLVRPETSAEPGA